MKRSMVAAVVGLAALICVAAGVHFFQSSSRARADAQNAGGDRLPIAASTAAGATPSSTPSSRTPSEMAPQAPAFAASTNSSAAPLGSGAAPSASDGLGAVDEPSRGAALGAGASLPSGRSVEEAPIGVPVEATDSLVGQAQHALAIGAKARAMTLARQAVRQAPEDADTWLTLGAAFQATGDGAGAREAYRSCVAQAHTANVSDCRALAAR